MSRLLAATEPTRTIVIERGGTAWWIPFATALLVALFAAAASYYATWRFKKGDVNRKNAFGAADLIDEAAQLVSRQDRYGAEGGANATLRLVQRSRVRAEPIDDAELDERFRAALSFHYDVLTWREEPGPARHWLAEAIWNVRAGLVPYLSAPRLARRKQPRERSFPTSADLSDMPRHAHDGNVLIGALIDWRANQEREA
jgi:hypothetical protein